MGDSGGTILVICYGNLCRSPMAEGLLQARLGEAWDVNSAGTNAFGGDPPSALGVEAIQNEYGIDISAQRSSPLTVESIAAADHVFAMSAQQAHLAAALGGAADRVRLFGAFHPDLTQHSGSADPGGGPASMYEVVDPMGGTYEEYARCLKRLHDCTEKAAAWLEAGAAAEDGPPAVGSARWQFLSA